jgi:hypothetical protein
LVQTLAVIKGANYRIVGNLEDVTEPQARVAQQHCRRKAIRSQHCIALLYRGVIQ